MVQHVVCHVSVFNSHVAPDSWWQSPFRHRTLKETQDCDRRVIRIALKINDGATVTVNAAVNHESPSKKRRNRVVNRKYMKGGGEVTPKTNGAKLLRPELQQQLCNQNSEISDSYRISLWFPSICQRASGERTLYTRLRMAFIDLSLLPMGSTLFMALLSLHLCTCTPCETR